MAEIHQFGAHGKTKKSLIELIQSCLLPADVFIEQLAACGKVDRRAGLVNQEGRVKCLIRRVSYPCAMIRRVLAAPFTAAIAIVIRSSKKRIGMHESFELARGAVSYTHL